MPELENQAEFCFAPLPYFALYDRIILKNIIVIDERNNTITIPYVGFTYGPLDVG